MHTHKKKKPWPASLVNCVNWIRSLSLVTTENFSFIYLFDKATPNATDPFYHRLLSTSLPRARTKFINMLMFIHKFMAPMRASWHFLEQSSKSIKGFCHLTIRIPHNHVLHLHMDKSKSITSSHHTLKGKRKDMLVFVSIVPYFYAFLTTFQTKVHLCNDLHIHIVSLNLWPT